MHNMSTEKRARLMKAGNRIYEIDGFLMYVHSYPGGYIASTNHNATAELIKAELTFATDFQTAVNEMISFALRHNIPQL